MGGGAGGTGGAGGAVPRTKRKSIVSGSGHRGRALKYAKSRRQFDSPGRPAPTLLGPATTFLPPPAHSHLTRQERRHGGGVCRGVPARDRMGGHARRARPARNRLLLLLLPAAAAAAAAAARCAHPHPATAAILANLTDVVPGLDCPALVGQPPAAPSSSSPSSLPPLLPRALHFVSVGGRSPLPPKYCPNLASFVACLAAEGYSIYLWTDAPVPACLPAGVTPRDPAALVAASPALAAALAARPNVGYRADLVRYAVLAAEGGVYSDVDATCLRSPAAAWWVLGGEKR